MPTAKKTAKKATKKPATKSTAKKPASKTTSKKPAARKPAAKKALKSESTLGGVPSSVVPDAPDYVDPPRSSGGCC